MDSNKHFLDKREESIAKYQKFVATDSAKARKYIRMLDFKETNFY